MGTYTLIVTEKPDAAARIASALDAEGKPKRMLDKGVPFYVATRNGEIVVVPALGHLYTVAAEKKGRDYPVFNYKWVPLYMADRTAKRTRAWLGTIAKLAKDADAFVDACDFDI
ncbi:MAG TPA: toprim domain-containing protein, partial [Candidatus Bathyarchaeia archaeon]|nr:toprim domain-containing protein [Candidatus Bathyarchaeia archaeon]